MLTYDSIKDSASILLAFTTLTREEFELLLMPFQQAWDEYVEETYIKGKQRKRARGGGRKAKLYTIDDKLLFIIPTV